MVGIAVGISVLIGSGWKVVQWWRGRKPPKVSVLEAALPQKEQNQIACEDCQAVFTPKWKEKETITGDVIQYAKCPQCGFENEFEVDWDEEEDSAEDE